MRQGTMPGSPTALERGGSNGLFPNREDGVGVVGIRVVAFARCPGFVVNHRGEQSRAFTTLQKL